MSPELFKCYTNDLSENLNNMQDLDVSVLNEVRISHLLWADDLVLLGLNAESLQKMLDHLFAFGLGWGFSVNIKMTAVLVFNKSGKLLKRVLDYFMETHTLPQIVSLTLSLSGSMATSQKKPKQKARRSYFSLNKMTDFKRLKKNILFLSSSQR